MKHVDGLLWLAIALMVLVGTLTVGPFFVHVFDQASEALK